MCSERSGSRLVDIDLALSSDDDDDGDDNDNDGVSQQQHQCVQLLVQFPVHHKVRLMVQCFVAVWVEVCSA